MINEKEGRKEGRKRGKEGGRKREEERHLVLCGKILVFPSTASTSSNSAISISFLRQKIKLMQVVLIILPITSS